MRNNQGCLVQVLLKHRLSRLAQRAFGYGTHDPQGAVENLDLPQLYSVRYPRANRAAGRRAPLPSLPSHPQDCSDWQHAEARPVARIPFGGDVTDAAAGLIGLSGRSPMKCHRCNGIMVKDTFEDMSDDTGSLSFPGWRCITCGEVLDPVIARNRESHREPLLGRARKKFATQLS